MSYQRLERYHQWWIYLIEIMIWSIVIGKSFIIWLDTSILVIHKFYNHFTKWNNISNNSGWKAITFNCCYEILIYLLLRLLGKILPVRITNNLIIMLFWIFNFFIISAGDLTTLTLRFVISLQWAEIWWSLTSSSSKH